MGSVIPLRDLTVGGTSAWRFRLTAIDVVTGLVAFDVLDSSGQTVLMTAEISPDAKAGTIKVTDVLMDAEVTLVTQHFVAGDIIRHPGDEAGLTYVVTGMSDDDRFVYTDKASQYGLLSGEYVRVGHVDPGTVA